MNAPTAKRLRISAVIFLGLLLACAGNARLALVRAQSSQTQSPPAAPSQDASPQQPSTAAAPAPSAPAPPGADMAELTTEEASVPLRVLVNLVPVRVIVRDANGNAVATLHKEDFQLYQDGKPQLISNFSVETPASANAVVATNSAPAAPAQPGEPAVPAFQAASRFVALLFDDGLLNQQDLMQARSAADKFVDSSVKPTDRVAVFTVSGQNQLDFTDDRVKLHKALSELKIITVAV